MKTTANRTVLSLALLLFWPTLSLPVWAEVTVIVNASNNTTLDDDTISNLFLGQARSFAGGTEATPVNQAAGSNAAQEFSTKFLKKTPPQLRAFWAKQVFTGGSKPPKELDGDEAVMKFVASTPGAIGYVETTKLIAGVKAVKR
jgi:ABC-type phosphate transport system substrate-binding protein